MKAVIIDKINCLIINSLLAVYAKFTIITDMIATDKKYSNNNLIYSIVFYM